MCLRWSLGHLDLILQAAGSFLSWIVGQKMLGSLWSLLYLAIAAKLFVWFVGMFSPEAAKRLEPLAMLLPWGLKMLGKVAWGTARALYFLVEGKAQTAKQKKVAIDVRDSG